MQPLWQKYRDQFPVTQRLVYLNHAAVTPLCRPAAEAMQRLAQDALEFGSEHYQKWMETYQGIRVATARLINATPEEIAIVKNTTEGIATVATGIRWKTGDVVVAFEEEFPANFYPWKRLEASGIEVRWLSIFDDLDKIDAACKGARMLAISYVQYLSGYRVNLESIGEIVARGAAVCFWSMPFRGWSFPHRRAGRERSTRWRRTGTSGCWVRRGAVFFMCAPSGAG